MQQSVFPLLVFDLDGTLADTAEDLIGTLNVIFAREGLPGVSLAQARPLVGGGARALIRRALAFHKIVPDEPRLDALLAAFLAHYEAHIAEKTVLFPGVTGALDRFEAEGFGFAVCTNKVEHASIRLLQALGIYERFRAVCGKDTFAVNKPDGQALLQTIARAGGEPRRAVMIGDSKTDIETARNAGVPVVAVSFGYTEEPVNLFKPDRVIGHYDELWAAVEEIGIFKSQSALTCGSLPS
ncbi:MAG TPA: HAD-IA family hydrolase [Methylocella sp.]|nr:HAD-IA family hydrolase [Methylocella sp.]